MYWTHVNDWLKVDEADPGFQLLTNEEIVQSLNERNENETDSDEDDDNATNTRPLMAEKDVYKRQV